jgi:NAD(P)-dependent dehydrogenase (short-subunit alcohol dehydrogenase family)
MGLLDDRVVIITGAGRGIGREHALYMASQGASVVVNDLGDVSEVIDEITASGGKATGNTDDITTVSGARNLVATAFQTFGDIHALVNNAGIIRDKMLVTMEEQDWDDVIKVHLKGHFCPTQAVAQYWRTKAKEQGEDSVKAALVHTTSTSGLLGNVGQTNYGAAKAGIASFSNICSMELARYGVRSNAIAPAARTRMTEHTPGFEDMVKAPQDPNAFDAWHPANVSPMVAYLVSENCKFNGETFFVTGGLIQKFIPWAMSEAPGDKLLRSSRWTLDEIAAEFA